MLLATLIKELKLLSRDIHALAVLFFMPLAFILIMSFALQDTYNKHSNVNITGQLIIDKRDSFSLNLERYLHNIPYLAWLNNPSSLAAAKEHVKLKHQDFVLHISPTEQLNSDNETIYAIHLWLSPSVSAQSLLLIESAIKEGLGKNRLHIFLQQLNDGTDKQIADNIKAISEKDRIDSEFLYLSDSPLQTPTSVQQSVPAWLVFAMFFVLIPMSSTMMSEIQLGTLRRLRTMQMSASRFMLGKIIPFLLINQVQFFIMLATGKYLLPLLGGEKLVVNGTLDGLLVMSITTSIAAVGFALLISVIAKTQEQATALGGTCNIILAAIGGIMVPKFIMPPAMQTFANSSPMSWGLDGFLEIILHGGNTLNALPYAASLLFFGIMAIVLSIYLFKKRIHYND